MKKQLSTLLITILSFASFAQISYEKGYFIDYDNHKIECLINNRDWRNNPSEFKYKLSENNKANIGTLESVKEFGVGNESSFKSIKVDIDRSSDNPNKLSLQRAPSFNQERLFLRVLVEGKSSLYSYIDGNLQRFFYKIDNSDVKQLIYKKYAPSKYEIRINERYKQQLLDDLKCGNTELNNIEKIDYNKKELMDFFIKYNRCNGSEQNFTGEDSKRKWLNLSIRPGLTISTFSVVNAKPYYSVSADLGTEIGFRIGLEAEYVLPFNKGKWSLLLEPTYQYYKSEINVEAELDILTWDSEMVYIDYKSIELPLGLRYYFLLNNKSKIFINASIVFDFPINSKVIFEESLRREPEVGSSSVLAFGLGYNYRNKYSLEFRYLNDRDIMSRYNLNLHSTYNSSSIILGYTIF